MSKNTPPLVDIIIVRSIYIEPAPAQHPTLDAIILDTELSGEFMKRMAFFVSPN